jgi:antitoxin ParD1/3/4
MSSSINLSLTNELRDFIEQQSGDGSLYSTPSEFMRALLREKKDRIEAAEFRLSVIEGYQDIIAGRTVEYKGNIRDSISRMKKSLKND